jgi:glutathione synthase/RimK-type ligase-like ATP-grasp enzyme
MQTPPRTDAGTRRDVARPGHRAAATLAIGILAEPRYLAQREPRALAAALRARGARVLTATPGTLAARALAGCVAVVARGRSAALLQALAGLEAGGVPVLNRPAAIAAVLDKARMAVALASAGLPGPATLHVAREDIPAAASRLGFPAIVKPVRGDNARGITVLRSAAEADALRFPEPTAVVQRFLPSRRLDLKLYVAGGAVHAVRKPSPLGPARGPAIRVPLAPDARALALRCGACFGLELYGVDCLETPAGLAVVEVNDFPNYTAVPEADEAAAALVAARAAGHRSTP